MLAEQSSIALGNYEALHALRHDVLSLAREVTRRGVEAWHRAGGTLDELTDEVHKGLGQQA